jgi:hypothetical protein
MWKVQTEILLRPEVKYECRSADFHDPPACSTTFLRHCSIEIHENTGDDLVADARPLRESLTNGGSLQIRLSLLFRKERLRK